MDNLLTVQKLDELIKKLGPPPEHTDITAGWRAADQLERTCQVDTVYGRFSIATVWIDPTIDVDGCYWGKPNAERLRAILGDAAEGWLAPEDRKRVE